MQDTPIADPDKFSLDEGTGDPQADADRLLDEARTLDSQETAAIATAPTEETYNAQLQTVIEEKVEQAGSVANMGHGRAASPSWGIRQHWRNAY